MGKQMDITHFRINVIFPDKIKKFGIHFTDHKCQLSHQLDWTELKKSLPCRVRASIIRRGFTQERFRIFPVDILTETGGFPFRLKIDFGLMSTNIFFIFEITPNDVKIVPFEHESPNESLLHRFELMERQFAV